MLSHFPARDADEPATRDHVRAEVAGLDQRMTIGFAETDRRFHELEQRMDSGFADVDRRFHELEQRMDSGFARMTVLVHTEMRRWFLWSYGAMFALLAAVVAAAKLLQ